MDPSIINAYHDPSQRGMWGLEEYKNYVIIKKKKIIILENVNLDGPLIESSPRIMKNKIPNKRNLLERHFNKYFKHC